MRIGHFSEFSITLVSFYFESIEHHYERNITMTLQWTCESLCLVTGGDRILKYENKIRNTLSDCESVFVIYRDVY